MLKELKDSPRPKRSFTEAPLRYAAALSTEVDPSLACAPFSSDAVRLVYKLKTPLSFQTTKNLEESVVAQEQRSDAWERHFRMKTSVGKVGNTQNKKFAVL